MKSAVKSPGGVPQWYVIDDDGRILAGAGVIENDFHERKDLAPNLCALFVEQDVRGQGLARELLRQIRTDIGGLGVSDLYLVTDHTAFYEKCVGATIIPDSSPGIYKDFLGGIEKRKAREEEKDEDGSGS